MLSESIDAVKRLFSRPKPILVCFWKPCFTSYFIGHISSLLLTKSHFNHNNIGKSQQLNADSTWASTTKLGYEDYFLILFLIWRHVRVFNRRLPPIPTCFLFLS